MELETNIMYYLWDTKDDPNYGSEEYASGIGLLLWVFLVCFCELDNNLNPLRFYMAAPLNSIA